MALCPHCNKEIKEGAIFCKHCKTFLQSTVQPRIGNFVIILCILSSVSSVFALISFKIPDLGDVLVYSQQRNEILTSIIFSILYGLFSFIFIPSFKSSLFEIAPFFLSQFSFSKILQIIVLIINVFIPIYCSWGFARFKKAAYFTYLILTIYSVIITLLLYLLPLLVWGPLESLAVNEFAIPLIIGVIFYAFVSGYFLKKLFEVKHLYKL